MSTIDLNFRPKGYFYPLSLEKHLLATVKAAVRQNHIRNLIEHNRLDELEEWAAHESLTEEVRTLRGKIHPLMMGGEYLPNLRKNEVEIARISLMSATGDVISVRATRGKNRISYRVVDEYYDEHDDESLRNKPTSRTSIKPLTLGQLEQLIESTGAGMDIIRNNLIYGELEPDDLLGFLSATSPYYPDLDALYQQRFDELVKSEMSDIKAKIAKSKLIDDEIDEPDDLNDIVSENQNEGIDAPPSEWTERQMMDFFLKTVNTSKSDIDLQSRVDQIEKWRISKQKYYSACSDFKVRFLTALFPDQKATNLSLAVFAERNMDIAADLVKQLLEVTKADCNMFLTSGPHFSRPEANFYLMPIARNCAKLGIRVQAAADSLSIPIPQELRIGELPYLP